MATNQESCDSTISKAAEKNIVCTRSCKELMDAYVDIYNHSQILIQKMHTVHVSKYLRLSKSQWDDYYNKSRSQTIIERLINGYVWRLDKEPGMFLEPPKMQWVVLHPSVVIENVPEALDGNDTQEGIMIEMLGVNWWQVDKWYQPSGASLITLYSDRADVKDWGYGIAVHFSNKFTIGAVDHDGDIGYFVSVDLLDLFKNKKTLIDEYIGKVKTLQKTLDNP